MYRKSRKLLAWCLTVSMLLTQLILTNVVFAATTIGSGSSLYTAITSGDSNSYALSCSEVLETTDKTYSKQDYDMIGDQFCISQYQGALYAIPAGAIIEIIANEDGVKKAVNVYSLSEDGRWLTPENWHNWFGGPYGLDLINTPDYDQPEEMETGKIFTYTASNGGVFLLVDIYTSETTVPKQYLFYVKKEAEALVTVHDVNGIKWVMEPADFYDVYDFTDGVGVVRKNNKTGAVDHNGNLIVPFKYDYIYPFYNGFAIVIDHAIGHGLIDKTGREIIPCGNGYSPMPYMGGINLMGPASPEGLVSVIKDGKYGFSDTNGKLVTPLIYDVITPSQEGMALAQRDGKYGFIDKTGAEAIPCIYKYASDFSEGLAPVEINGKFGFINQKGELEIPCIYDGAAIFSSGLSCVYTKEKGIQYIDREGNIIISRINIEGTYTGYNAYSFGKDLALVVKRDSSGDHFGFMNKKGEISPLIYEDPSMSGGARRDGKCGMLNSNLEEFVPFIYDDISGFSEDLCVVTKDGKTGYIDRTGKLVIPCIYDTSNAFSEGLACVRLNGKYGYIDKTGKMIIEPIFDRGSSFNGGVAWGCVNGKFGIIENPLKGTSTPATTVTPTPYDSFVTSDSAEKITSTNAVLYGTAYNPTGLKMTKAGVRIGTSSDLLNIEKIDIVNLTMKKVPIWYDLNKYKMTLKANTTYYYQFYAILEGKEYKGEVKSFTTLNSVTPSSGANSFIPRTKAPAWDGSSIYYPKDKVFNGTKFLWKNGNCTTYAYARAYEILGKPISLLFKTNAKNWADVNRRNNFFNYGEVPKLGAIAVFDGTKDFPYGHVAIVEKIENGKVYFSESSYDSSEFIYNPSWSISISAKSRFSGKYMQPLITYIYLID